QAMPDVTVGSAVQMRAVVAAAANTAVDRGKASYSVDLARAVAALSSGQAVSVVYTPPAEADKGLKVPRYPVDEPGKTSQFLPSQAVALAYPVTGGSAALGLAFSNEYRGGQYVANAGVLESLESTDAAHNTFRAARGGASITNPGTTTLS